jgi:hypothetical protein
VLFVEGKVSGRGSGPGGKAVGLIEGIKGSKLVRLECVCREKGAKGHVRPHVYRRRSAKIKPLRTSAYLFDKML